MKGWPVRETRHIHHAIWIQMSRILSLIFDWERESAVRLSAETDIWSGSLHVRYTTLR
jgi:hypothetical protein